MISQPSNTYCYCCWSSKKVLAGRIASLVVNTRLLHLDTSTLTIALLATALLMLSLICTALHIGSCLSFCVIRIIWPNSVALAIGLAVGLAVGLTIGLAIAIGFRVNITVAVVIALYTA